MNKSFGFKWLIIWLDNGFIKNTAMIYAVSKMVGNTYKIWVIFSVLRSELYSVSMATKDTPYLGQVLSRYPNLSSSEETMWTSAYEVIIHTTDQWKVETVVFWDMALCNLVEIYQSFEETCCFVPDDECSTSFQARWTHSRLHCITSQHIMLNVIIINSNLIA